MLPETAIQELTPAGLASVERKVGRPPTHSPERSETALDPKQLFELEKMKLQCKLAEIEKNKMIENNKKIALAQIALEERKIQNELEKKSKEGEYRLKREQEKKRFKPSEASLLLPVFVDDVDSYFRAFEKIAEQNEWPRDKWLSILVPRLVGKAYRVYASADSDNGLEEIKAAILRAYSVTPDSYRQQFRNLKKGFDQSFSEFAQELTRKFKKWVEATERKTFEQLINFNVLELDI